jgi:hypothetical protein
MDSTRRISRHALHKRMEFFQQEMPALLEKGGGMFLLKKPVIGYL